MKKTLFTIILAAAAAIRAEPLLTWRAEIAVPQAARIQVIRGETVGIAADLFDHGEPYAPFGAVATYYYVRRHFAADNRHLRVVVVRERDKAHVQPVRGETLAQAVPRGAVFALEVAERLVPKVHPAVLAHVEHRGRVVRLQRAASREYSRNSACILVEERFVPPKSAVATAFTMSARSPSNMSPCDRNAAKSVQPPMRESMYARYACATAFTMSARSPDASTFINGFVGGDGIDHAPPPDRLDPLARAGRDGLAVRDLLRIERTIVLVVRLADGNLL